MKTLKFILLFLLISGSIIYSLPKPKNNNIGGFIGNIQIDVDKIEDINIVMGPFREFKYFEVKILVENITTKKNI